MALVPYTAEVIRTILSCRCETDNFSNRFYLAKDLHEWRQLIGEHTKELPEHVVIFLTRESEQYYALVAKKSEEADGESATLEIAIYGSQKFDQLPGGFMPALRHCLSGSFSSHVTYSPVSDPSRVLLTEMLFQVLTQGCVSPRGKIDAEEAIAAQRKACEKMLKNILETGGAVRRELIRRYVAYYSVLQYMSKILEDSHSALTQQQKFELACLSIFSKEFTSEEMVKQLPSAFLFNALGYLLSEEDQSDEFNQDVSKQSAGLLNRLLAIEKELKGKVSDYLSQPSHWLAVRGGQLARGLWSLTPVSLGASVGGWAAGKVISRYHFWVSGVVAGALLQGYQMAQEEYSAVISQMALMAVGQYVTKWLRDERVDLHAGTASYNKSAPDWVMAGTRMLSFLIAGFAAYSYDNYRIAMITLSAIATSYGLQRLTKCILQNTQADEVDLANAKLLSGMAGMYLGGAFSLGTVNYLRKSAVRTQMEGMIHSGVWSRQCEYHLDAGWRSFLFRHNDTVQVRCGTQTMDCNISSTPDGVGTLVDCPNLTSVPMLPA